MDRKNLIQVKPGIYLSKDDPEFLKKYIKYCPDDADKHFEYAELLKKQKKFKEAEEMMKEAARKGSVDAKMTLYAVTNKKNGVSVPLAPNQPNQKKAQTRGVAVPITLIVIAFLIFLVFLLMLAKKEIETNRFHKEEYHYYHYLNHASNPSEIKKKTLEMIEKQVYAQGLETYKEIHGEYPKEASQLYGQTPNNVMSKVASEWSVFQDAGQAPFFPTLELRFYPEERVLALASGESIIVQYPAAFGEDTKKIGESTVKGRVIDPNGGDSVFGTRGLELGDDFAIHGTNEPESIGKMVTDGCIRLFNEHIEELYPYVAVGTKFSIVSGNTKTEPLFPEGLPKLDILNPEKEKTPDIVYTWKS